MDYWVNKWKISCSPSKYLKMEDKAFKRVMTHSKMETSEGFTEDLMKKLASQKIERPTSINLVLDPMIWCLGLVAVTLMIIFYLVPFSNFTIMGYTLPVKKTPLAVMIIFLLLFGINHMLRLKNQVSAINRKLATY